MLPPAITPALFKTAKDFITSDIFREVQLARAVDDDPRTEALVRAAGIDIGGAGNFLCALGLLCYTDFLARLKLDAENAKRKKKRKLYGRTAFHAFFETLGSGYKAFQDKHDVYDLCRGGMVHNYHMKKPFGVSMRGPEGSCGISVQPNGAYLFIVAQYAMDLLAAMEKLEAEVFSSASTRR